MRIAGMVVSALLLAGCVDASPAAGPESPEVPAIAQAPAAAASTDIFGNFPEALRRLALDGTQSIFEEKHLWIRGPQLSINPSLKDPAGFNALFAPPLFATTRLDFRIDDKPADLQEYQWRIGEIQRTGSAGNIRIDSLLTALPDARGLLLTLRATNRGPSAAEPSVSLALDAPTLRQSAEFGFSALRNGPKDALTLEQQPDPGRMVFTNAAGALALATDLPGARRSGKKWTARLSLEPGQSRRFDVALLLGPRDETLRSLPGILERPDDRIAQARSFWAGQLDALYARLPRLISDNPRLVAFYERSLLSVPLSRWDLPGLVVSPCYACSGLDSGAFCAYFWDYAYAAQITPLCDPAAARKTLVQMLKSQPMAHYAFNPFDGKPLGPHYSYNQYALVRSIYYYVLHTADTPFLNELVDGKTVLEHVIAQATFKDDLSKPPALIDYGDNHNLLELKTQTYQAFVPSPNAERCWSYRAADALSALAGKPSPNLSPRAEALSALLLAKLWDPAAGWFRTLTRDGRPQLCYSIQIFDLLRLDILDTPRRQALLRHLNPDEFLSPQGLHSLSKQDPGYDPKDVDWGGPGCYTADPPELIADLYHSGHPQQAGDLLSRILWWGQRLPYYPQAIRADRIDYRRDGRSNLQAGIAGAQALIFGLLGLEVSPAGALSIRPHLPPDTQSLSFQGVRIRNRRFDAALTPQGCTVTLPDGRKLTTPLGEKLPLPD